MEALSDSHPSDGSEFASANPGSQITTTAPLLHTRVPF